jgi:hypothetical protein
MVQPRRMSRWLLLCVLACLSVLSLASPRLWDNAFRAPAKRGLARATQQRPLPGDGERRAASEVRSGGPVIVRPALCMPPSPVIDSPQVNSVAHTEQLEPHDLPESEEISGPHPPAEAETDLLPAPADEVAAEPATEGPAPVTPKGKIGAEATEPPKKNEKSNAGTPTPGLTLDLPSLIRRLPMVVANVPSPIRTVPQEGVQFPAGVMYPDTDQPRSLIPTSPELQRQRAERSADDRWREPETLLESLNGLAAGGPTAKWAAEVVREIRALGSAVAGGSDQSGAILERLAELDCQAPQLATTIADKALAKKLKKTAYALGRRIDVWQEVVRLGVPQPVHDTAPELDPHKLALCLAEVDSLTANSPEGQAWRQYLLVDALKESAKRQPSYDDRATRQIAQQVLARLTQSPMTAHQQKFVASGPVAALRGELRHWAAEPIGAAAVLRDIETYERTSLPSDAHRLAMDYQSLALAPIEGRRQMAERVDLHYRNANVRIALTEEFLNRLIPERNLEYALVDDTVLGYPVRGESLMTTDMAVRMQPDPQHVRMVLEVKGEISAATTASAGPARLHNDSESSYVARKPLEIDMAGISVWPVEVGVNNQTRLNGVSTPLDAIPLIGAMARGVAKSQSEQNRSAADEEVRQKIAAQARERVDAEAREYLSQFVARMNQRVFDPLNSLSLDPQMIEAQTTEKRFFMRLRLAGEDQLGSHTPRPQAFEDSLASVQIHESVLNNGIQRLQLNGRTFSLPELSQHVAARLSRPAPWEINPKHADVKITFAEKDAVVVRCQDGQVILTLSIAQLSKPPRNKWKNFQIQAFYRPEVNGRSAQLARSGVIHLTGQRLSTGARIALSGIFSCALSKNNAWNLVPAQIVNEPKLADAAITQFVIDDGWIGVSLGPKRPAVTTARRPQWGVR